MNTTLSDISQTQKDEFCLFPLYEVPRTDKFIETGCRRVVAKGWGREREREKGKKDAEEE